MSRKTKRLLWSAPLVAVFAVIGALAALASLSPGGVLAQDAMMGPPTGLRATVNSQTQITLNWNAPAGLVNTYRIDMSEDGEVWEELVDSGGAGPLQGPDPGTASFVVVQGNTGRYVHGSTAGNVGALDPGTTYRYRVFAIYSTGGEGEPTAPIMATTSPAIAPAPPTGLIVSTTTAPTADTIRLTWVAPTGVATGGSAITGYKIEGSMAGGGWQTLEEAFDGDDDPDATGEAGIQYDHDDLMASTMWSYRVSSINKAGTGLASDPIDGTTAAGGLPAEVATLYAQGTDTSGRLIWLAPADPDGAPITDYRIERQAQIAGTATDNPDTAAVDESAWAVFATANAATTTRSVGPAVAFVNDQDNTDPTDDTTARWTYRVSAINSVGTGPVTGTPLVFTAPPASLSAVTGLKAAGQSPTEIQLSWSAPLRGTPTGYTVLVSTDGRVWTALTRADAALLTETHSGLTPSQTRHYQVSNSDGTSQWSHVVRATTKAARAPGAPTTLTATIVSATQIDLAWVAPVEAMLYGSTITGYRVERSLDQIDWVTAAETKGAGLAHMDKGLTPGTMYYYRVRAMTAGGTGNASNIASAETLDAAALGQPSGLVAFARGSSRIDLYWLTPGDPAGAPITGYRVEYSTDNGANWMNANANTMSRSTMWSHMGLMAETEYTYRVSAINSEGTGSPSVDDSATTGVPSVPGMPTGVSAMADSDTEITVSWMAPANMGASAITHYIIERRYDGDGAGDITPAGYNANVNGASFAFSNHMEWWETLNCTGMLQAAGSDEDPAGSGPDKMMYCAHYSNTAPTNTTGTIMAGDATDMAIQALFDKRFVITGSTATTYTDTGLMAETEYTYRVSAVNSAGRSSWSAAAMATTEATPAELMAPANIRVNPVGSGLVNVGWDGVSGAAGYTIVAVNTADPTQVMTESVNNPNAVAGQIGNLMVGGVYNIYVGSFDANLDFAVDLSLRKRVTVE